MEAKGRSMDLRQEITNHIRWIDSLASLLDSDELTDETFNAISEHDKCALGRWLASDESKGFWELPEFERLSESHKAFHDLAAKMVEALQLDQETDVMVLHTQFVEASQKVIGYLQQLHESSGK